MTDPEESRPVDYHRILPWLHLARAFRIAIDPRKLFLAAMALAVLAGTDAVYESVRLGEALPPAERTSEEAGSAAVMRTYCRAAQQWPWDNVGFAATGDSAREVAGRAVAFGSETILAPVGTVGLPLKTLLHAEVEWIDWGYLLFRVLWALAVWAIVAGAITRMVALEFARDERLGTMAAMRYAGSRFLSFLFAPIIAVVCIGFVVLFCWLGGLVGAIPTVGPIFAGALWFLPLLAGFVITLVVVGAALGWPLMYATISTQDSDAFDGFSRSYTFVYGRPWYYAWLIAVAMVLGTVGLGIVHYFATATDQYAQQAVATGMGGDNVRALVGETHGNNGTDLAIFWRQFLMLVAGGFGASFFWVSATIAYFLLRRSDDGTELDEVEVQYDAPVDTLAPLAGVSEPPAASDPPIVELSTAVAAEEPEASPQSNGDGESPAESGEATGESGDADDEPKTEE